MSDGADNPLPTGTADPAAAGSASSDVHATALSDNPFESPAEVNAEPAARDLALPACFRSIEPQLPAQVRAKLLGCDVTQAEVTLSSEDGGAASPVRMAFLMTRDFARSCAARVGRGGMLFAEVVEPGRKPWGFAFEVPEAAAQGGDPMAQLARRLEEKFARALDDLRLEAGLSGGGRRQDTTRELLRDLKEMGVIGQQQSGNNLTELVAAMTAINGFAEKSQISAIDQMLKAREMTDKLGMGKAPERTMAQELKEVLEIGPVKTLAEEGTRAVVRRISRRDGGPEAAAEKPAESIQDNPFAEMGAA